MYIYIYICIYIYIDIYIYIYISHAMKHIIMGERLAHYATKTYMDITKKTLH